MTNVSQFIIQRIKDAGADTLFGIPGDYILPFFDDLVDPKSPVKHWGTTNELTATNLADGYARERGFGAVAVTFGPGIFNTVNGVAGCYSENVPVFVISGAPNVSEHGKGKLLHHLVGTDMDFCMRVMKPITAAAERIEDVSKAVEIVDRLITIALTEKKPVYLELPYNIQILECPNITPWKFNPAPTNQAKLDQAMEQILKLHQQAEKPAFLPGVLIERHQLQQAAEEFLQRSGAPFATSFDQKCGFLEYLPNCVGFYQGAMSDKAVLGAIEGSDCLISLGMPNTEFNTGMFTGKVKDDQIIYLGLDYINVRGEMYEGVHFRDSFPRLTEILAGSKNVDPVPLPDTFVFTRSKPLNVEPEKTICVDKLFDRMAHYIEDGDIVTGDTGGYINLTRLRMRKGNTSSGPGNWGSLGAGFPIAAGIKIASPDRRAIMITGDGSYQMTGQELATLVKNNVDFCLIVMNNEGYTAERAIQPEKTEAGLDTYNDIQPWQYSKLAEVYGAPESMRGHVVKTEGDLEEALAKFKPGCGPYVIDVILDKLDVASFNLAMSAAMKH